MSSHGPKVSVCVVTYNQEKFIGKCLEGLVSQRTDFEFEILVGDDCSIDRTPDIIRQYADAYPELVRPILHDANIGPFKNYQAIHALAQGDYVAHMDGDDFSFPDKLNAQVEMLERNPDCAAVFHKLEMVDIDGMPIGRNWPESCPEGFDIEFLVLNHPIAGHSSLMYRKGHVKEIFNLIGRFIDFRIYVELAKKGRLGFVDRVLGQYTVGAGISNGNSWIPEVMAAIDEAAKSGVTEGVIRKAKARHLFRAALNAFYRGEDATFRSFIEESRRNGVVSLDSRVFYLLRNSVSALRRLDACRKFVQRVGLIGDRKMLFPSPQSAKKAEG